MNEAEAKTKWCPFARYRVLNSSVNRSNDVRIPGPTLCLASDCMAWCWEDREDTEGYCGLVTRRRAGDPQLRHT
jgi:hypothetical protein